MSQKITKRSVDQLSSGSKDVILWGLRGHGARPARSLHQTAKLPRADDQAVDFAQLGRAQQDEVRVTADPA
jgi:hypothetical protein